MLALPLHLQGTQAKGLIQQEPIAQYEIGTMRNFIYLLICWITKRAIVVDPQKDLGPWWNDLAREGITLEEVWLTHSHHDHIAGLKPLMERVPGLRVRVGAEDQHRLPREVQDAFEIVPFTDQEWLAVGQVRAQALHSPGHSRGEFCVFIPSQPGVVDPYVFTGDTLFIRDCGRTDLETGSDVEMFATLQKLKTLPDETIVLVGHHYAPDVASRIGIEKHESPPLRCRNVEELSALA
jgi:hydroxyacylglutathione hydrolase